MYAISKRLMDLLEKEVNLKELAKFLKLSNMSIIYDWRRGECIPSTKYLIGIADFLKYSMDYLLCRTDYVGDEIETQKGSSFTEQIKTIMKAKGISQYRMVKINKVCNSNDFFRWNYLKDIPNYETLIKLADYFKVSVDELLGRE